MRSKCLCHKTYYTNGYLTFSKDKWYEYTTEKFVEREMPAGYNVQFSKGNWLCFRKNQDTLLSPKGFGLFNTHFKTFKDIRKEKIKQINGMSRNNNIL